MGSARGWSGGSPAPADSAQRKAMQALRIVAAAFLWLLICCCFVAMCWLMFAIPTDW